MAVVGSGAIGIYYGGRLAQSGVDVRFLLRGDYDVVKDRGLTVDSVAGDFHLSEPSVNRNTEDMGTVDLVVIAWKATANDYLQEVLTPLVGEGTRLLTLQNGLGNTEKLAELFGAHRVFGGLCFVCINRVGAGHVRHTAAGLVRLGAYGVGSSPGKRAELDEMVSVFSRADIECEAVADLEHAQWMKLVWNIPFNGLSIAMGGVDTQELLATDGMEQRVVRLMREVQSVASAYGHVIEDGFLEKQLEVTRPMGPYRPSSMIDFVEGRAVEVEAIWHEPLKRASEAGVAVPELERLVSEIDKQLVRRGK